MSPLPCLLPARPRLRAGGVTGCFLIWSDVGWEITGDRVLVPFKFCMFARRWDAEADVSRTDAAVIAVKMGEAAESVRHVTAGQRVCLQAEHLQWRSHVDNLVPCGSTHYFYCKMKDAACSRHRCLQTAEVIKPNGGLKPLLTFAVISSFESSCV